VPSTVERAKHLASETQADSSSDIVVKLIEDFEVKLGGEGCDGDLLYD
jgi:hypothetical protein